MDAPPYWCFCWASGQVLARYILHSPHLVAGKTVLDFGAGSGVVAIAAALAGASRVISCDTDQHALKAARLNAAQNNCVLEFAADLNDVLEQVCAAVPYNKRVICVADVFYDRENLPLLANFNDLFATVLVADSRLQGRSLPGLTKLAEYSSFTVPDLNESSAFNRVTVYAK